MRIRASSTSKSLPKKSDLEGLSELKALTSELLHRLMALGVTILDS